MADNATNAEGTPAETASTEAASTNGTSTEGKQEKVKVNKELLEATIDVIRQSLQADGGDVILVNCDDDGVVTLEMQGACAGCPLSSYDMSEGIERILREHVPGVTKVVPSIEW